MRVLFDYNGIDIFQFGGVAQYTFELMRRLPTFCEVVHEAMYSVYTDAALIPNVQPPPTVLRILPFVRMRGFCCRSYCRW